MRCRQLLATCAVIVGSSIVIAGQDPSLARKTFEVASIKRSEAATTLSASGALPGGRFIMTNASFQRALLFAYPVDSREIIGAPDWVASDRYDITAIGAPGSTRQDLQEMMRSLLAERLQLAVHYEDRERPTYALKVARADGRLGPSLRRTPIDCTTANAPLGVRNPTAANGAPLCGFSARMGVMKGGGIPIAQLARALMFDAGRPVVDKTGLPGTYEFTLEYAAQSPAPESNSDRPQLTTALREQLGLELTPDRTPLSVLVIDRIAKPTAD